MFQAHKQTRWETETPPWRANKVVMHAKKPKHGLDP
jgi:hypothetical protein